MSSTLIAEVTPTAGALDPRRALLKRVVCSAVFAKSERLSSFLICVCELTLSGRASEINEQKIGTLLFRRSSHYDSSIDGIVRTQASRLRQRLDRYFDGEGADEPIRICLPRGSYVPVFETKALPQPVPAPLPNPEAIDPPFQYGDGAFVAPKSKGTRKLLIAWGLVAILSFAVITLSLNKRRAVVQESAGFRVPQHPLWSLLFIRDEPTVAVSGDSGLVMFEGLTKKTVGLADYLSGDYRSTSVGTSATPDINAVDLARRRYTSIVDLEVVTALSRIADIQKSTLEPRYARDIRPNDLKNGNLVLIGAAAANPWVELFEPNMNFVFSQALAHQYTVINRKPSGTEPLQWTSNYGDAKHKVYGVVAFLPNLNGKGNVLILEGTSMPGTESAWDFVSDDTQLLPFLKRIKHADGSVPHFQCVLGTENMNGSSVKSAILAWRVMD
jgi:hypothetical protein